MTNEKERPLLWMASRRRFLIYGAVISVAIALIELTAWRDRHGLVINVTESLPNWAFWIDRTRLPVRGDYVFFRVVPTPLIRAHFGNRPKPFGKILYGIPGDTVTREGRTFFVNGVPVVTAKSHTRKGMPLRLGPTGIIPAGHYFVATPHKDGFDSRYADIGWVPARQLIGVGTPIL